MPKKKVEVIFKNTGQAGKIFQYEKDLAEKEGRLAKKAPKAKEEKSEPQTKENKQAANRKTK